MSIAGIGYYNQTIAYYAGGQQKAADNSGNEVFAAATAAYAKTDTDAENTRMPAADENMKPEDYLARMRKWRDIQFDTGNMEDYRKAAEICNDLLGQIDKQNGTAEFAQKLTGTTEMNRIDGMLKSGIIGLSSFGEGDNFNFLTASYAYNSTAENPVIEVRISSEDGSRTNIYNVKINEIDPRNATQMEIFALCAHADVQGLSGFDRSGEAYMNLLYFAGACGDKGYTAENLVDFTNKQEDWTAVIAEGKTALREESGEADAETAALTEQWYELLGTLMDTYIEKLTTEATESVIKQGEAALAAAAGTEDKADKSTGIEKLAEAVPGEDKPLGADLLERMNGKKKAPYSYLADENGIINYNGVVFVCDDKKQTISLGDTSNPDNCLNIPLENGGCLVVNRDNLGDLSSAIGMFSPEDVNRILRAIAQDAKLQQMQNEIEEDKNSIGDGSTNAANNEGQKDEEVVPAELFDTKKSTDMSDVTEEMVRRLVEDRA